MGNWRTIEITGTCPPDQVDALRTACELEYLSYSPEQLTEAIRAGEEFPEDPHCLSWTQRGSLCGIERWVAENIAASGNVGKDVHEEEVAETLADLARVAPGLSVTIHMGDDHESEQCVSTIVLADGEVVVGPPLVSAVHGVAGSEISKRMDRMLAESSDAMQQA